MQNGEENLMLIFWHIYKINQLILHTQISFYTPALP